MQDFEQSWLETSYSGNICGQRLRTAARLRTAGLKNNKVLLYKCATQECLIELLQPGQ